MNWRRRLVYRVRAWSEKPDPEDAELIAMAAGALFLLAICNVRRCVRWLFARRDVRTSARRVSSASIVRAVVVAPPVVSAEARGTSMCIFGGPRCWWRRTRRGYLLASLHLVDLDHRGAVIMRRGPIVVVGRTRRSRVGPHDALTHEFAIGDRVEVRAIFLPELPMYGPYRPMPVLVAHGVVEIRVFR